MINGTELNMSMEELLKLAASTPELTEVPTATERAEVEELTALIDQLDQEIQATRAKAKTAFEDKYIVKDGKIQRERIAFVDALKGGCKIHIKYIDTIIQVVRNVSKDIIEVVASVRMTDDQETNTLRLRDALGKEHKLATLQKMLKGTKVSTNLGYVYLRRVLSESPNAYLKRANDETTKYQEYYQNMSNDWENKKKNDRFFLTPNNTQKNTTIYRLGLELTLDRVFDNGRVRWMAEDNVAGVVEQLRDGSFVMKNGDIKEQYEFDLEYKMFGERVDREAANEYEENNVIEELYNELCLGL